MNKRIGEFFINLNILSFDQIEHILKIQNENPNKKFGEIAVELAYLEQSDIEIYLGKINK